MLYIDVTDLILWARKNSKVTGIQRVHIKFAVNAISHGAKCFMFYGKNSQKLTLVSDEFIHHIDNILAGPIKINRKLFFSQCQNARLFPWPEYEGKYPKNTIKFWLHSAGGLIRFYLTAWLFEAPGDYPNFSSGDVVLSIGRGWTLGGYAKSIENIKSTHGISPHLFIHDLIPIPDELRSGSPKRFLNFIKDAFKTFDRFYTSSNYNCSEISKYMLEFIGKEKPIHKLSFGQDIAPTTQPHPLPENLASGNFILCVGRIDESKNQLRLIKAWHKVVLAKSTHGAKLVLLGRLSKNYHEFRSYINSNSELSETLVIVQKASDSLLNSLYKNCLFTVFPSTIEGYGLPAAESAAYGKFCLASNATSIPEAAGPHADFFNPYDEDELQQKLVFYFTNRSALQAREALIKNTPIKTWSQATAELIKRVSEA